MHFSFSGIIFRATKGGYKGQRAKTEPLCPGGTKKEAALAASSKNAMED